MRVIIKPAGAMLLTGSLVVVSSLVYARYQKSHVRAAAETAPTGLFVSHKAKAAAGVFDSKDKMVPVDLSEVGTQDWVHWGLGGNKHVTRKDGDRRIGSFELIQPKVGLLSDAAQRGPSRGFAWQDGAPTRSTRVTYDGVHVSANNGFRFSVPAEKKDHTLVVYVGGYKAGGIFSAWVTDGNQPEIRKEDIALGNGYYSRAYRVKYHASSPGQELKVVWKMENGGGNISLQAAALQ
jgi:hypothetical protein